MIIQKLNKIYRFITPEDFKLFLNNKFTPKQHSLLITFDDGFKCQFDSAQECLNSYNIKAIFFIPTEFINTTDKQALQFINNNMKVSNYPNKALSTPISMSWEHIQTLHNQGHLIGAHTASHLRLNKELTPLAIKSELELPKELFKKKLNIDVDDFAIPFGNTESITKQNLNYIKKHYTYIYCSIRGFAGKNKSSIFRENLDISDSIKTQELMINGCFHWLYKKKRELIQTWL